MLVHLTKYHTRCIGIIGIALLKYKNTTKYNDNIILYILNDPSSICCGRPVVKWLGKLASEPKVPGSNPGQGMDVEMSVLGPTSCCAQKLVDGRCQVQSPVALVDLAVRSFPWFSPKLA